MGIFFICWLLACAYIVWMVWYLRQRRGRQRQAEIRERADKFWDSLGEPTDDEINRWLDLEYYGAVLPRHQSADCEDVDPDLTI